MTDAPPILPLPTSVEQVTPELVRIWLNYFLPQDYVPLSYDYDEEEDEFEDPRIDLAVVEFRNAMQQVPLPFADFSDIVMEFEELVMNQ